MGMGVEIEPSLVSVLSLCFLAIGFVVFVHADEVPGFINIACGASGDVRNTVEGLVYKSDKDLIDSGIGRQIAKEFRSQWQSPYLNLRSFPNGTRNCYRLQPEGEAEAGTIAKYLIRASFVYGNYDGFNSTPNFDLYLGANYWATVDLDSVSLDAITIPSTPTDYIEVCLVNTNNGVPYISAMKLRPLDISLYRIDPTDNAKFSVRWTRLDIGGSKQFGYPQDVYDRLWSGYQCDMLGYNNSRLVSTNAASTESNDDDPYNLPQSLLQTACRARNSTSPLEYTWTPDETWSRFYFCFHFAEIEKLEAGQFREMRIVLNDVHTITESVKLLQYLRPHTFCSKGYVVIPNQLNKLSIYATSPSSLLSSMGLRFFVPRRIQIHSPSPKMVHDSLYVYVVNAIRDIKQHYKLRRNWEGDPCGPPAFSWEGLNCSSAHPWARIISLNLSSSNLTGDIASSISTLNAIKYLDLSYNELEGAIPESLVLLPQLQLLNLSGNNLTGVVPEPLLKKFKDGTLVLSVEGNPELCLSPPCNHKKELAIGIPIFCSVVAVLVIIIILLGVIIIYTRKTKENLVEPEHQGSLKLKNQRYSYSEVVRITDNFEVVIGEGGFGKVYLGALEDLTMVAVKVLSPSSQQGYKEFRAEAQLLMILHHRNLVSLLGYCDEDDHKALIYEYMANGSLQQYLSNTNTNTNSNTDTLSWTGRLQIAVDAAQGLEYLHNGCKPPIIHRDLKPSNILLDKTMQAKIADFGLSRTFATENGSQLLTRIAGTPGYLDPGTQTCGNVNKQSDVYSFGIILLELITGQPAVTRSSQGNFHILNWVEPMIRTGDIQNIIDLKLGGQFNQNSAWGIVELAMSCTQPTALKRPEMGYVLEELKECLAVNQSNTTQTRIISTRFLSESEIAPFAR